MTMPRVVWDTLKKIWTLPDGVMTPSFATAYELVKAMHPNKEVKFVTDGPITKAKAVMSSTEYYERYYGRRSRPSKVDKVLDQLTGAPKKTPVKPVDMDFSKGNVPRRVIIRHKSPLA
jgi:hypothetical protein